MATSSPIPPMLIELQLETAKITAQLQQFQGKFDEMGKTVEKNTSFFSKFKATAAGVFAGNLMQEGLMSIKTAFSDAIKDADEFEKLLNKTKAVIESTGGVAGVSAEHIRKQAAALEQVAAVDENVILNGQNVIATFTQIRNVAGEGNDIFDQTTKAALDLSAALGQDMQSSAIQLGKALNDPIKGVTALQRVGVTFDAQQKQMIKTMVEAGDTLGAQKVILAEVNREFGGAAKAAGDTFGGAIFRLKDKVQDFMRNALLVLQPILLDIGKVIGDIISKYIKPLAEWIGKNKEVVLTFVAVLGAAATAFGIYTAVMKLAAAAQAIFNAILAANPIVLAVVAIAALAAGFVYAYNKFEPFRKAVVDGVKIIVQGFGYLVGAVGKLLEALSHIPGIGGKFKGVSNAVNDAAKNIGDFAKKLDGLKDKKISISLGVKSADDLMKGAKSATAPTTVTADQLKAQQKAAKERQKEIEKNVKEAQKLNDEMSKVIAEANAKAAEETAKYEQKKADTIAKYAKKELEIIKKKDEELAKNKADWQAAYDKAYATNAKELAKIDQDYANKRKQIEQTFQEDKAKLIADSQKKIAEATAKAADEQAKIIQQSIDRLRSAFASGTAASITEIFKAGATKADDMLKQLQDKLSAAKKLQDNAAALAAAGYSQVFIEDVVKNGPEIGNQMAEALLNASDDTKKQLQDLYFQVNNISQHGVDDLAKTMNAGGKLATEELMKAYNAVPEDLRKTLTDIDSELQKGLAEAQKHYNESMTEAATARDAAIAESKAKLAEALAAADKELADANAKTMKDFNDAMAQNAADLADALAQIQKDYEDTIDQINKDTKAKLADLQAQLKAVMDTLIALQAAQAAATAAAATPVFTGVTTSGSSTSKSSSSTSTSKSTVVNNNNVSITGVNLTDPEIATRAVINSIKYGNAVKVYDSPFETNSSAYRLNTPQGVANKIAAGGGGRGSAYFE